MGNERQARRVSPKETAQLQEMDRQWILEFMPPQRDVNGMDRVCVLCHSLLNPIYNHNYDGTVGGFCNKLCRHDFERKMMLEGMSIEEADLESGKYEDWKPKKHALVV